MNKEQYKEYYLTKKEKFCFANTFQQVIVDCWKALPTCKGHSRGCQTSALNRIHRDMQIYKYRREQTHYVCMSCVCVYRVNMIYPSSINRVNTWQCVNELDTSTQGQNNCNVLLSLLTTGCVSPWFICHSIRINQLSFTLFETGKSYKNKTSAICFDLNIVHTQFVHWHVRQFTWDHKQAIVWNMDRYTSLYSSSIPQIPRRTQACSFRCGWVGRKYVIRDYHTK